MVSLGLDKMRTVREGRRTLHGGVLQGVDAVGDDETCRSVSFPALAQLSDPILICPGTSDQDPWHHRMFYVYRLVRTGGEEGGHRLHWRVVSDARPN